MIIILDAGHTSKSPGACHQGKCEFPETQAWVSEVAFHIRGMGGEVLRVPETTLTQRVKLINQYCKALEYSRRKAILVSIHFNSAPGVGEINGCETLYYPGSAAGEMLATVVQNSISVNMHNHNRGIKEGWFQGDKSSGDLLYLLEKTTCPAVIAEPEFIQSYDNIKLRMKRACEGLAGALVGHYLR